jgi:hypothetical protein
MAAKKSSPPPSPPLKAGEKVYRTDSEIRSVFIIVSIDHEAGTATVNLNDTELQGFKYPISKLTRSKENNVILSI